MSTGKSFEQELAETLNTVRALHARVPDEIEDYLHDSIVKAIVQKRNLSIWWGYIYTAIKQRLKFGREAQPYVPIEESIVPCVERVGLDTKLDLMKAISTLSSKQQIYIHQHFMEGYTLEEIAKKHQVSHQAVWKTIKQALGELRKKLRDDTL